MGGCQSKAVENSVHNAAANNHRGSRPSSLHGPAGGTTASVSTGRNGTSKTRRNNANHTTTTAARQRLDSWATTSAPPHHSTATTSGGRTHPTVQQQQQPRPPVELQWKFLWDTFASHLVDPVDVPAVLDSLINRTINRLSPVQLTLLQRKVRQALQTPNGGSGKNNSLVAKVWGGGSSNHNSANQEEARLAADKTHLLIPTVWQSVLPSWNSAAGLDEDDHALLLQNVAQLLGHLSDSTWDRVTTSARQAAEAAELDLDVNHQRTNQDNNNNDDDKPHNPMPKPSRVPDWTEPPVLPAGITLTAMATLIAIAAAGTRSQKLQLLFYMCMPDLTNFLSLHPAGGAPLWLLEAVHDNNNATGEEDDEVIVVSLASLTHYHYFGTAFLPARVYSKERNDNKPAFCASKSRGPVQIPSALLWRVVQAFLTPPKAPSGSDSFLQQHSSHHHNSRHSSIHEDSNHDGGGDDSVLMEECNGHGGSSHHQRNGSNNSNGHNHHSSLTRQVFQATSAREMFERGNDTLLTNMPVPPPDDDDNNHNGNSTMWTLQDFAEWAEQALDDAALEIIMHRLFTAGILPTHAMEKELVQAQWETWQTAVEDWRSSNRLHESVQKALGNGNQTPTAMLNSSNHNGAAGASRVWGGMGGIDGAGGSGYGLLYCVDKQWWDDWVAYTGWSWLGERPNRRGSFERPGALSNERLLDREGYIRGICGSYEFMKHGLKKNKDYELVPPGVWNVLYELYGGGPPLLRMVKPPERKFSVGNRTSSGDPSDQAWEQGGEGDDLDAVMQELGLDVAGRVPRLPDYFSVTTHPWIVHCQLCDPTQPYRRGDAGIMSIRIMVTPDEPLWRMLGEIVTRFPLDAFKAFDSDRKGKARLWKRVEPAGQKGPTSRYGPWNVLCKSRHATLPLLQEESSYNIDEFVEDWKIYTDNATVESLLADQDHLMLEFAVQNKQGDLMWPREAAAKAGRVRRLVEEENEFRRILRGADKNGALMLNPPFLIGMEVDAMDGSGRWYTVMILAVEIMDDDTTDEEGAESDTPSDDRPSGSSSKKVKVDFSEHGGHIDWIDVESDRLGPAGRFTTEAEHQQATLPSPKANGPGSVNADTKAKGPVIVKKSSSTDIVGESAKLCPLPGFGACGLTNLGNTCYMNSALQCIGYLPLLRSYLLSSQFKATGDFNRDNPLGTGGKLLEEAAELLRVMWSARLGEKSPTRFKAQLSRINPQFSGADQQDAQEFLNYILDALHEDCNKVQNKPYVEALDDDWVKKTKLPRVGEEAWRRFLRRNRSIMADVAMGQVLNTVSCPVCDYSSRNFDPFNLLSIPIPTVADVIFQCTVIRRATALNCPWMLNKPKKGSKRSSRFVLENMNGDLGPPSESYATEQYVISMSRLADSSDLRVQIEKLCGISSTNLRLCRAEEVITEPSEQPDTFNTLTKLVPLNDKEGPCSQLAKKRSPNDNPLAEPTIIVAFQDTLVDRQKEARSEEETDIEDDNSDPEEPPVSLSVLDQYGDSEECRVCDTFPTMIAKTVSASLWPRDETEFRVGLRVDAKDHRGNWFAGSVVDVFDEVVAGADSDTGEEVRIQTKKACVHFDNFSPKWDETYTIDHFKEGKVRPLYSHASPKNKPTEFLVLHRLTDSASGTHRYFGQPFYVQCNNDWSNVRAGAQVVCQAARFMDYRSEVPPSDDSSELGPRVQRLYEKACGNMSDLIDVLVEADREYVRNALGLMQLGSRSTKSSSLRNPSFDVTPIATALASRVAELMPRLPFEIRVCSSDPTNAERTHARVEEDTFPFSLTKTIGNSMNARHVVVLHWRSPPKDRKTFSSIRTPVMYVAPHAEIHKESAELLKNSIVKKAPNEKEKRPGSAGIDLGVCLTEFCKVQKLSLDDNWRCPRCKDFREGKQNMNIWRLPDLLTFHIKRFNMSARWREKITTKVNFPLNGLDMSEWCHGESPVKREDPTNSYVYDLIGVMNHYGSMTGGHYVATCKATTCGRDGREEVSYGFNGVGMSEVESEESGTSSGWRLGRPKAEANQGKQAALLSSRAVSKSAEPMWLQFDDELVEPIPPDHVVSEMAYVLFYRRRRISPSNVARYSTLE